MMEGIYMEEKVFENRCNSVHGKECCWQAVPVRAENGDRSRTGAGIVSGYDRRKRKSWLARPQCRRFWMKG